MVRRMSRELAPFGGAVRQVAFIILISCFINISLIVLSKIVVDRGILGADATFITYVLVAQVVLHLAMLGLTTVRENLSAEISAKLVALVSLRAMQQILFAPLAQLTRWSHGELIERVRELQKIDAFGTEDLPEAAASICGLAAFGPLLVLIDWRVALIFVATAAAYGAWVIKFRPLRARFDAERFDVSAQSRALEMNLLRGVADIKLAGREQRSLLQWEALQLAHLKTRLSTGAMQNWQRRGGHLISRAGLIAITYMAAIGAARGQLSIGEFAITNLVAIQLFNNIEQLLRFSVRQQEVALAIDRVSEIEDLPSEMVSEHQDRRVEAAVQPIEVRNLVCGGAAGNRSILAGINLNVPAGATLAIVGPSGSGKSTLLKAILKLIDYDGHIAVGGSDLKGWQASDWHKQCAAVLQDGVVFDDTVEANIVCGREPDTLLLDQVLDWSCAAEIVDRLPAGIKTKLGSQGVALSAGERQRILLARSFYKRPNYLFLDEATSALDMRNERRVSLNIDLAAPTATKFIVAHRLETVRKADWIVVLNEGKIQEEGRHQDLLDHGGIYSELVLSAC